MANIMTKKTALSILSQCIKVCDLSAFTNEQQTKIGIAIDVVEGMIEQLSKPRANATEANEKRKEATAKARAVLVAAVVPVLRKHLTTDMTAKELYDAAASELPTDFNWQKVQSILLREMKEEVVKTEAKGKANTYRLK